MADPWETRVNFALEQMTAVLRERSETLRVRADRRSQLISTAVRRPQAVAVRAQAVAPSHDPLQVINHARSVGLPVGAIVVEDDFFRRSPDKLYSSDPICAAAAGMADQLISTVAEDILRSLDQAEKVLGEQEQQMAVKLDPSPELTYGLPGHNDPNALTMLRMEAGQNLHDYVQRLQQFLWGLVVNPPPLRDVVSPYLQPVWELGFRLCPVIRENPRTNLTDQLQIVKNKDLEQFEKLGSGASGTVYRAKWKGTDVAVKRFSIVPSSEQAQEFWREADILSKLRHPNVVAFYGIVEDGPGDTLATLTELMVNGSLGNVLRSKDKGLDLRKRLIIATDAAIGMDYLHSKNIVHFDLKSYNLLVDLRDHSRPICKVCDFGLSKIKNNTFVSGGAKGTLPWMAPELLNGATEVTEKVDVFSFAILMSELSTGEVPYANMHCGAIVGGIVNNTLRPTVPDNCEPEWRRLMEQCWSQDPARRPDFTEIAARLQSMAAAAAAI